MVPFKLTKIDFFLKLNETVDARLGSNTQVLRSLKRLAPLKHSRRSSGG